MYCITSLENGRIALIGPDAGGPIAEFADNDAGRTSALEVLGLLERERRATEKAVAERDALPLEGLNQWFSVSDIDPEDGTSSVAIVGPAGSSVLSAPLIDLARGRAVAAELNKLRERKIRAAREVIVRKRAERPHQMPSIPSTPGIYWFINPDTAPEVAQVKALDGSPAFRLFGGEFLSSIQSGAFFIGPISVPNFSFLGDAHE